MKYWIIDGDESNRYEDVDDICNYLFDVDNYDDDDAVDEWINECYYDQRCNIGGETFYPADIVKELDNYTYRELAREWAESQSENDTDYYYSEIENMDPGDEQWINSFKVECFDDEETLDTPEEEVIEGFNAIIGMTYSVRTVSDAPTTVQVIK